MAFLLQRLVDKSFPLSTADRKSFCTIHSTGYLKSWPPTKMGLDEDNEPDNEGCNLSCLVAIGRLHPHIIPQPMNGDIRVKPTEYVSRHAIDGKFVFVDQRWEGAFGSMWHYLQEWSSSRMFSRSFILHQLKFLLVAQKTTNNVWGEQIWLLAKMRFELSETSRVYKYWFQFMSVY